MTKTPLVGWYASSFDSSIASIRVRCHFPARKLRRQGLRTEFYAPFRRSHYGVVVFSKTYDNRALAEAARLKDVGCKVILDLCDNHFFGEDADPAIRERTLRLERMVDIADLVLTSTMHLEAQLVNRFPQLASRTSVIPDYPEEPSGRISLGSRFSLHGLRRFQARHSGALRLIWFGNHGANNAPAGMKDLRRVRQVLETHGSPLTLTVMSNSRATFDEVCRGWSIPTHYLEWSLDRVDAVLRKHDVAIVPIDLNPFTLAKTINRPATALRNGLGVIADGIPSYEELRPFIWLDDWPGGLEHYSRVRPQNDPRLYAARAHLARACDANAITELWAAALTLDGSPGRHQ